MKNSQNKKESIWILNHYAITPNMPGGIRHFDFGKELAKRGYRVTIFASSFHHGQRKELQLTGKEKYKIENVDGINFVWIKTFPYQKNDWQRVLNMISYMWRSYLLGRKIVKINQNIQKPDVIIGSSVHLLAVLSAYWLSKKYKAKFIMEVRDLWPQTLIDIGKFKENNPIVKFLRFLEKFLYKKAEKIITLLPYADKYITKLGISKDKIIWIPNGVDISRYKDFGKYNRGISNNFTLMYFGHHGEANALEVILKVAKILQKSKENLEFVFIGDGPEKLKLIQLAKDLKLQNVEFRDAVSKDKIAEITSEADAFIFNLKKAEVFEYGISPNKLFDYMTAGKPIIFSVNTTNSPVDETGCGISISPENPKEMAEAVIKLYQMSSEERKKMGQKGREYVKKYHNIPILVDKLEKVIQEVVNE